MNRSGGSSQGSMRQPRTGDRRGAAASAAPQGRVDASAGPHDAAGTRAGRSKPAIRILDLRDSPWVDGPGRTVLEIATALNASGYRYVIGSLMQEGAAFGPYAEEAQRRGLDVEAIRERHARDFRVLGQTLRAIERHGIDIVHTHEFRSDLIGLLCARRRRLPLVCTVHGWIANDIKGSIYTVLDKLILRFFDRIVVVSEKIRAQLIRWGIPGRKIVVVPNALQTERYRVDRTDDSFRRELGLRPDDVLVGKIGRLSAEKGHRDLLQAAASALKQCDRLRVVLIGIGPEEQSLRAQAKALGIEERILFAGYRNDMVRVYNSLDLVVQASYTEGMPNVVLEALLMGVPVVATRVGGTDEIVENGRSGVLIEPRRPDVLAGELIGFAREPERFRSMARSGQERIRQEFDSRRRIERMKVIYAELMSSAGRARRPTA